MTVLDARTEVTNPAGWTDCHPVGIAIHHTVTTVREKATESEERTHIRAIDAYHVSQGFGSFGYHLVVFPSGRIYHTGNLDRALAHVAHRNHELIGIAAVGDFTVNKPTSILLDALHEAHVFADPSQTLSYAGHAAWALPGQGTACPGALVEYYAHRFAEEITQPPSPPDIRQLAHALHFAYTLYWEGKRDQLHPTDFDALEYLLNWFKGAS